MDAKKVDKSIDDAVKNKKPPEVPIEPKIDNGKVLEQVAEAVKKAGQQVKSPKLEMPHFDFNPDQLRGMGTKLRDAVGNGLRELNNNPALKDVQEQIGQQVGAAIGKKVGEALGNTAVGEWARGAVEQVQNVTSTIQAISGALQSDDLGTKLGGINTAMAAIAPAAKNFGIDVSGWHIPDDVVNNASAVAGNIAGLKGGIGEFAKEVETVSPGIAASVSSWAGPIAAALVALQQINEWSDPNKHPGLHKWLVDHGFLPGETRGGPPGAGQPDAGPGPAVAPPTPGQETPTERLKRWWDLAPNPFNPFETQTHQRAGGGMAGVVNGVIRGPGTGTSDSILGWPAAVRVSKGEFITNEDDTAANLPLLQAVNSGVPVLDWLKGMPRFDSGGLVAGSAQLRQIIMQRFGISDIGGYRPADKYGEHATGRALDVMVGGDRARGDAVKDFALANAPAIDLKWVIWRQHLYYAGGGGYDMEDRGTPTDNHMDHVHIFSGTGIINGLLGALQGGGSNSPAATPAALNSDDGARAGSVPPPASGGAPAGAAPAAATGTGSGGGGFSIPTSLSGLSTFGLEGIGVKTKVTPSSPERTFDFGSVASAAISGQVSSALGAFGIPDSPHWLQGISQFVGGIKVGGPHDRATPASLHASGASPALASGPAAVPGVLGGPARQGHFGDVINIQTDRVEDAFKIAWNKKLERAATPLDHWT